MIRNAFVLGLLLVGSSTYAQDFLTPSLTYSHKKDAHVTLTDGTEMVCKIDKIKRKKGLIKLIRVEVDGAVKELNPSDVSSMYLPPSGYDKLTKASMFLNDATKWTNDKLEQDLLNQGLVYFEQANVEIKKGKTMTMLMQLLNPSFSGGVKVYHDPFAKETASAGVGGVKLVGGIAKSYFVLKGDGPAVNFEKKKYKKSFNEFWSDCDTILTKYADDVRWNEFNEQVVLYDQECVNQ